MITSGTPAKPMQGTEYDFTADQSKEMVLGKVYSANFNVSGLLSSSEQQVMDGIIDQIVYPAGHPEAYGRCNPTYVFVDSASGTAYAEWTLNPDAMDVEPNIAPLLAFVIIGAILIVIGIIIYVVLSKATEFVAEGKDNPMLWMAILCGAGAIMLVAGAYAYGKIISDKPIMKHIEERRAGQ